MMKGGIVLTPQVTVTAGGTLIDDGCPEVGTADAALVI